MAEELERRGGVSIQWIGTGRPVERRALAQHPWEYRILHVLPLTGRSLLRVGTALAHLPLSVARAVRALRAWRPHVVLGLGGYCSGPVVLAAWLMGIPAVLHEQNLVPGLANRMAARFARTICISFPGTADHLPREKVVVTGNPVRPSLLTDRSAPPGRSFRILVMGGSQGARGINRLATSALPLVVQGGTEIEVLHQAGPTDIEEVKERYASGSIAAEVVPFIDDMARAYQWADLVVCRAGASTLAELTVLGKPAILIPFPAAAGNHQEKNARALEAAGAAKVCIEEETGAVRFASMVQELVSNPGLLEEMSRRARSMGRPEATGKIAEIILRTAKRN